MNFKKEKNNMFFGFLFYFFAWIQILKMEIKKEIKNKEHFF